MFRRRSLAGGDLLAARRALENRGARRPLGRIAAMLGDYETAEALLHPRRDAATLALVHWRTGRFDRARVVRGVPLSRVMTAFGDEPYRIEWHADEAALPFLQRTSWELPRVEIEIDGRRIESWIDTGGDTLTVPHDFGVEPLATFDGTWSGAYGRVESVRLGPVTVRAVPVMTAGFARPVIGTGFLSRFLPTIDYPGAGLVLRPRNAEPPDGIEVPFAIASTHLLLVRGSLGAADLNLLVDSGLEDEHGAAFTASATTLATAGIPRPAGRYAIPRLALGAVEQRDLVGIHGVFPPQLATAAGFPIHGLVSHGFLRRYRWTIDFMRMTMRFAPPG